MLSDRRWKALRSHESFDLFQMPVGVAAVCRAIVENVRVREVAHLCQLLATCPENPTRLLIVYTKSVSFGVRTLLTGIDVECVAQAALEIDPTQHILQPNYTLLDPLQSYLVRQVYVHQMPVMCDTDPVAAWYSWPPGSVLHICPGLHEISWADNFVGSLCPECRFREVVKNAQ
jgi:hypothetical protein